MDKNWLIRTKSNHILGPISKEKVLELYKNGSIKPDDEVCSGNGFWFFIREEEMVTKYLNGNEVQTFNPISEAKDVLTHGQTPGPETDDITLVGGINLSMLNKEETAVPPVPDLPPPAHKSQFSSPKETGSQDPKKKNNSKMRAKGVPSRPLKKQGYLRYLGIIGFIVLFLLIYFRKTIIRSLFEGEMTFSAPALIHSAHAQADETPSEKKKLLEASISIEKVSFKPVIGLNGFVVTSSFDIEEITCEDFKTDIYQLGVILHPPEVLNEKFLIRLRDCVVKLSDTHPLKRWLKWVSKSKPLDAKDQKKQTFLNEIINTSFNLITDTKVKNQIIDLLDEVPEDTMPEQVLRSYLYLMIGNITRSDNILRSIVNTTPRVNWEKRPQVESFYHRIAGLQFGQIFKKFAKHPADRRSFELFGMYITSFYNEEGLVNMAKDIDVSELEEKIGLRYIEELAPSFVHYLRLKEVSETVRVKRLRNIQKFPLNEQAYWIWPFLDINPLISDSMNPEIERIEKEDQLWFIYLMDNEKLADVFSKKTGKSFLPGRRPYLKSNLTTPPGFMMSLYKLIELGDINPELVQTTINFIAHE
ncbi:hypothetical protein [Peredibacter starrii]|uniref:GYF domain-containing protein n=1 Tax=Peredibacter starrii TaxID=28202 RepID=A0AAX4HSQ6_9BACT|nr:hypothetical protein [Peredibacter starrii]WPU66138.1 hypothetical protein SOO65_05205 [Peredibacter starrii]